MFAFTLFLFASIAAAGPGTDGIAAARDALESGDTERASILLAQARLNLPREESVLSARVVAELIYLEGMTPVVAGVNREEDVDRWRDALTVFPRLKWNREIWDDKALRGYFEALRAEVSQRDPVPSRVPERRGLIKAFVDGVEHSPAQAVRAGPHLIQVECPGGDVRGAWSDLTDAPDWIGMCPGTVDLAQAPEKTDDEFAFDEVGPNQGPEPLAWVEPQAPVRVRQPIRVPERTLWIGAGVASAVSLVAYTAALAARGQYDKVDPPAFNSVSELERQRAKTNRLVGISGGMLVVAGGLSVGAVVGVEF